MSSFREATAVKPVDSHHYSADFRDDWCVGSVPHGGYVTTVFLNVAAKHFRTTLSKQNQPHTITLHLEFLRRTHAGPATFKVKDVKLGRQTSTIHVTLSQGNREEVVAYMTNSDIHTEAGPTFDTKWALHPSPYAVDVSKLKEGQDKNWKELKDVPFPAFRKAMDKLQMFLPRKGQKEKSLADEWICFRNGEKFTNSSLGYVSDAWPQLNEAFRTERNPYSVVEHDPEDADAQKPGPNTSSWWYPTLLLNLDIKKALPDEGVEWLFARVRAKQIRNGRFDVEVVVLDDMGDIVALSHHVCLILGAERNLADRKTGGSEEQSKL